MRALGALARLNTGLDRVVAAACIVLFAAIFVTMILQIGFRYLLNAPLVWTEELARYLYIWACWLGASVALRRGSHITVAFLAGRLPPAAGRGLALGLHAVALVFFATLVVQGLALTARAHTILAITLPIPWSAIYLAAPVAAALMGLQTVEAAWAILARGSAEPVR